MVNNYYVIDFHSHCYPEKIASKAVKGIDDFYGFISKRKGTVDDLINDDSGIDKFVISSSATSKLQVEAINDFISTSIQMNDEKFIGLGTMHPDYDNKLDELKRIKSLNLKGIKMHSDVQKIAIDDKRNIETFKICEKLGLVVLLHIGDIRYDYSNANRLKNLLSSFEGVKLVGAHFAGYMDWEKSAEILYKTKNLYVDCSSSFEFLNKETSEKIIKLYGANRVLFGTDYPVNEPKEVLKYFFDLNLTKEEKEQILYKNALKVIDN